MFYNNSAFDGRSASADAADDGAVAPNKTALLPGEMPTLVNVTSYSRGLNGVMIDLVGRAGVEGALAFHTARSPGAGDWASAPAPVQIVRRAGAGAGGSDRVTVVWADGAMVNRWLRVTVPPDAQGRYGDVFYFGNLVGETGALAPLPPLTPPLTLPSALAVDGADLMATRAAASGAPAKIASRFDHNRDGWVNALDVATVRRAVFSTLPVAPAGPAPTILAAAPRPRRSIYTLLDT